VVLVLDDHVTWLREPNSETDDFVEAGAPVVATGSTESRSSVLCTGEMLRNTTLIVIEGVHQGLLEAYWISGRCAGSLGVGFRRRCRPVSELRVQDDLGGAIVLSSKVNTPTMRCGN
jgi:hypothetical protein